MKTAPPPRNAGHAENGVAEWSGSMVRGLAALEFLERSSDLAAEAVIAMPVLASVADVSATEQSPGANAAWL
jgi:hypothetical protein